MSVNKQNFKILGMSISLKKIKNLESLNFSKIGLLIDYELRKILMEKTGGSPRSFTNHT